MIDQLGRAPKFEVNRRLTDEEYEKQIFPYIYEKDDSTCIGDESDEFMTTIKMNSSYLELVDRCLFNRGNSTYVGLLFLAAGIFGTVLSILTPINTPLIATLLLFGIVLGIIYGFAYYALKPELFNLTHNPIRFDRRNRMVYAFLYNKEVVAAPWEDIFFCVDKGNDTGILTVYDIRGHILADDGVTVKATFALGYRGDYQSLGKYWHFINSYMEKGPEELVSMVKIYHPIADQKESPAWGLNSIFSVYGFLISPLTIGIWGSRILAIATSRRPIWPDWVEEKCKIEPDDPYARDARINPPIKIFTNFDKLHDHYRLQRLRPTFEGQNLFEEGPYRGGGMSIGVVIGIIFGTIVTVALLYGIYYVKMYHT